MSLHNVMRSGFSHTLRTANVISIREGGSFQAVLAERIGKREIVGYGMNGQPSYFDRPEFPMPAIRFREVTPDIQVLREKELGNWKNLSIEEKKSLYRASFCQTFAEVSAPTGDWKRIIGITLTAVSLALGLYMLEKIFVYPPLPDSCTPENQRKLLKYMIDIRANPIEGVSSKWDYETNRWKK